MDSSDSGGAGRGLRSCGDCLAYNGEDVMPERDVAKAISLLEEAGLTKDSDGNYLTLNFPNMTGFDAIATVFRTT